MYASLKQDGVTDEVVERPEMRANVKGREKGRKNGAGKEEVVETKRKWKSGGRDKDKDGEGVEE